MTVMHPLTLRSKQNFSQNDRSLNRNINYNIKDPAKRGLFFLFCYVIICHISSLITGQDMQRGPPLPLESSDREIVLTSMPFLSRRSLVT